MPSLYRLTTAAFLFEVVFFFFFWCGTGCTAIGSVLVEVACPSRVSIVTSVWLPFCCAWLGQEKREGARGGVAEVSNMNGGQ